MKALAVALCLIAASNYVEFDKPEYGFNCSNPPAYEYVTVRVLMDGDWWPDEAWLRFEYNAGLQLRHKNLIPGDGWTYPDSVWVESYTATPTYHDSAVTVHMFCRPWLFYPPGELCVLGYVWSPTGTCYDDTLFLRTFWRDGGAQIHNAPDIGTRLRGVVNTGGPLSTWGRVKALYRREEDGQ